MGRRLAGGHGVIESDVQKNIRKLATLEGGRLLRNNVGVAVFPPKGTKPPPGSRRVAYGVGGKGGADLIGITPLVIGLEHVGLCVGIFTAIETKGQRTKIEETQEKFAAMVSKAGGLSLITKDPNDFTRLTRKARQGKGFGRSTHGTLPGT